MLPKLTLRLTFSLFPARLQLSHTGLIAPPAVAVLRARLLRLARKLARHSTDRLILRPLVEMVVPAVALLPRVGRLRRPCSVATQVKLVSERHARLKRAPIGPLPVRGVEVPVPAAASRVVRLPSDVP